MRVVSTILNEFKIQIDANRNKHKYETIFAASLVNSVDCHIYYANKFGLGSTTNISSIEKTAKN